jgi:hypothetical protein
MLQMVNHLAGSVSLIALRAAWHDATPEARAQLLEEIVPRSSASTAPRLLSARSVATRYGSHLGSLSRWLASGILPPPITIINRVRFWDIRDLEAADRRRLVEHARHSPKAGPPAQSSNHHIEDPP